jgi:lysophospholipase L1-like esterase
MRGCVRYPLFVGYTVIVCLVGGELAVRAAYDRFRDYNMEMWRYASELKLPLDGERLPFHHRPDRAGDFYGVEIRTNSFGLRDREYTIDKPQGTERIVVLGDSFTLGWGVPLEDVFSKRLERLLNQDGARYQVINMGIGNYNTTMEVELFKWKGLDLDPDIVILAYFVNDTESIPAAKPAVMYALVRNSYFCAFLFDRMTRLRSRFISDFTWTSYYRSLYSPENSSNLTRTRESLMELIELCDAGGIDLLIVSIPELREVGDYRFSYATEYVRGLAQEGGVPFLDLLPALSAHEPESLWVSPEDPHANGLANAIFAEEIYNRITTDGVVE